MNVCFCPSCHILLFFVYVFGYESADGGGWCVTGLTVEELEEKKRLETEAKMKKEAQEKAELERQEAEETEMRKKRHEEWVCMIHDASICLCKIRQFMDKPAD